MFLKSKKSKKVKKKENKKNYSVVHNILVIEITSHGNKDLVTDIKLFSFSHQKIKLICSFFNVFIKNGRIILNRSVTPFKCKVSWITLLFKIKIK